MNIIKAGYEVHSRIPIVFDDVWIQMHNNLNKH